jgi:hypothetical protein
MEKIMLLGQKSLGFVFTANVKRKSDPLYLSESGWTEDIFEAIKFKTFSIMMEYLRNSPENKFNDYKYNGFQQIITSWGTKEILVSANNTRMFRKG